MTSLHLPIPQQSHHHFSPPHTPRDANADFASLSDTEWCRIIWSLGYVKRYASDLWPPTRDSERNCTFRSSRSLYRRTPDALTLCLDISRSEYLLTWTDNTALPFVSWGGRESKAILVYTVSVSQTPHGEAWSTASRSWTRPAESVAQGLSVCLSVLLSSCENQTQSLLPVSQGLYHRTIISALNLRTKIPANPSRDSAESKPQNPPN